jgi:hypothetical protein
MIFIDRAEIPKYLAAVERVLDTKAANLSETLSLAPVSVQEWKSLAESLRSHSSQSVIDSLRSEIHSLEDKARRCKTEAISKLTRFGLEIVKGIVVVAVGGGQQALGAIPDVAAQLRSVEQTAGPRSEGAPEKPSSASEKPSSDGAPENPSSASEKPSSEGASEKPSVAPLSLAGLIKAWSLSSLDVGVLALALDRYMERGSVEHDIELKQKQLQYLVETRNSGSHFVNCLKLYLQMIKARVADDLDIEGALITETTDFENRVGDRQGMHMREYVVDKIRRMDDVHYF